MIQLKRFMLRHWLINSTIYAIIYLFKSFAQWEFRNPFQWVIDIPTYSIGERGAGLLGFITIQLVIAFYTWILTQEKQ